MKPPSDWYSDAPYGGCVIRRRMVKGAAGEYPAYIRYSEDRLRPDMRACTNGNVITLTPEAIGPNADRVTVQSLIAHELQHVIQYFEVEDSDARYNADPLKYEKEAYARQLIKKPINEQLLTRMREGLQKLGMTAAAADEFIATVQATRRYPGVTDPRED